jgi:hypothetical protein
VLPSYIAAPPCATDTLSAHLTQEIALQHIHKHVRLRAAICKLTFTLLYLSLTPPHPGHAET